MDASVVVSAAIRSTGIPRQAIVAARRRGSIALSAAVFREITEVLARPKFVKLIAPEQRSEVSDLLVSAAVWAEWRGPRVEDCRDRKDNIYLELALAAGASAIVSGDDDLLVLDSWRDVRIFSPAAFLKQEPV